MSDRPEKARRAEGRGTEDAGSPQPPGPPVAVRRLHGLLLLAWPRGVRRRFGEELRADFAAAWAEARRRGRGAVAALLARTVRDVAVNAVRHRIREPIRSHPSKVAGGGTIPPPGPAAAPGKPSITTRILHDLRHTARSLRSAPLFSAAVVLTLGLGIGASTAIFSVVDAVLLEALPYPESDRLVRVWTRFPENDQSEFPLSAAEFLDYRRESDALETMAAAWSFEAVVGGTDDPERLLVAATTAEYWEIFGGRAAPGRTYSAAEDRPGSDDVAVLSHRLWQERFAGDPAVVGRGIRVNDSLLEVIGVMPPGFRPPGARPTLWTPLALDPDALTGRSGHFLDVVGRLAPGTGLPELRAEMEVVFERWERAYDHAHPFQAVLLREQMLGDVDDALLLLLAAVGLVLLIACANVAGMMLARSEERHRELAIRKALGAGQGRLVGQMLTESVVLGLIAGLVGLAVAAWGTGALLALEPGDLPRMEDIGMDTRVLSFGLALSALTGLMFGSIPAHRAARRPVREALQQAGGRTGRSGGRHATQRALVVAEVALAVVLVAGAGLLTRSFARLTATDPGLDTGSLVTARLGLPPERYDESEKIVSFWDRLLPELEALPGVQGASMVRRLPVLDPPYQESFLRQGQETSHDSTPPAFDYQIVAPGYFGTARIPLLAGRDFDSRDRADGRRVAIVSDALARHHFPEVDPVGQRILILAADRQEVPFEIVGVAADVRHNGLDRDPPGQIYVPYAQAAHYTSWAARAFALVLRADGDPAPTLAAVRDTVRSIDPGLALSNATTVDEVLRRSVAGPRFLALLLSTFSGLALLLAAIGTYGVVSYGVSRRIGEFGVRMALGARPGDVLRLVLRQGMAPVALGLLLGVGASLALSRLLSGLLYETAPTDPLVHAVTVLGLVAVATLATWIPARRATAVDPARSLAGE